ncbi:hypothetical protein OSTOST_13993 [Ostertagia ostertagi]
MALTTSIPLRGVAAPGPPTLVISSGVAHAGSADAHEARVDELSAHREMAARATLKARHGVGDSKDAAVEDIAAHCAITAKGRAVGDADAAAAEAGAGKQEVARAGLGQPARAAHPLGQRRQGAGHHIDAAVIGGNLNGAGRREREAAGKPQGAAIEGDAASRRAEHAVRAGCH